MVGVCVSQQWLSIEAFGYANRSEIVIVGLDAYASRLRSGGWLAGICGTNMRLDQG